jgi:hypothetical protein
MTMTGIAALFSRHVTAERRRGALAMLQRMGLARPVWRETGGRPEESWEATWTP